MKISASRTPQRTRTNCTDRGGQRVKSQRVAAVTPTSRNTLTPCTRFSRLAVSDESEQQADDDSTTKYYAYSAPDGPWVDDGDALFGENKYKGQNHPNLTMVLDHDKINMDHGPQALKEIVSMHRQAPGYYISEEESDEDDSSFQGFSPVVSPERGQEFKAIFDAIPDVSSEDASGATGISKDAEDSHYDPTSLWTTQIYVDNSDELDMDLAFHENNLNEDDAESNIENRPPRQWGSHSETLAKKSMLAKRSRMYSNAQGRSRSERIPLQEIVDTLDDLDHQRKKPVLDTAPGPSLSSPSISRRHFMRSLSPVRSD